MKTITFNAPKSLENIELHILADEHIGDPHTDLDGLLRRIDYIEKTPNAFALLNGDLMNNATTTSVSDTYGETMNPDSQIDYVVDNFGRIKNKIVGATSGNHEFRTYKMDGIDPTKTICDRLGIIDKYSPNGLFIFIKMIKDGGKKSDRIQYSLYMTHGSGGGRKEGSKAVRLADMASIVDADIYIHSHTHLPMVFKEGFFRSNIQLNQVTPVTKLFVNSSANQAYAGYGQAAEFKPIAIAHPITYLNGNEKVFNTLL